MTSRRRFLQGIGAGLALPFLPSLTSTARAMSGTPRVVYLVVPNGMPMDRWRPSGEGLGWIPSPILQPLAGREAELTLIEGCFTTGAAIEQHASASIALLTGLDSPPWDPSPGADVTSVDQVLAETVGASKPFPLLSLTSEGPSPCPEALGDMPSCGPFWTVSWRGDGTAVIPELSVQQAFERLTGLRNERPEDRLRRQVRDQALLDFVTEDAARVRRTLSGEDRLRLDRYLTGVDELERRLYDPTTFTGACRDSADRFALAHGEPTDLPAHVDAMLDLIVLALECDLTQVATYMLGNVRSDRPMPHLGISGSHHHLSHQNFDPDALDSLEAIGRWEVEVYAALLDKLAATPDGVGTLLDHTLVVFLSPLSNPWEHLHDDIPTILAGGTATGLHTPAGRLALEGESLARLHLTVLERMGTGRSEFGFETRAFSGF